MVDFWLFVVFACFSVVCIMLDVAVYYIML